MRFYFYLYGKKTGQLKILTRRNNSKSETSVFKQYGNHGHRWNFAQVFLDFSPLDTFQVNFTNFLFFLVLLISCLFLQMIILFLMSELIVVFIGQERISGGYFASFTTQNQLLATRKQTGGSCFKE